jgi:3D (Asp-Asp-Asp) domain-containing protein
MKTSHLVDMTLLIIFVGCFYSLVWNKTYLSGVKSIPINTTPIIHVIKQQTYDKKATFTAYTLNESETDGTPCIGAGNHNLCVEQSKNTRRICASRFLPLHTIIEIETIGDCEVLDRISYKYSERIDILFKTKEEAIKFGKKTLNYKVIDN